MKSAGSRYVLWALCHLALPAHPNRSWNKETEAIAIKAENVAPLAPGLSSPGKAEDKLLACFLAKENGAEQALLYLEENINVHGAGRATMG